MQTVISRIKVSSLSKQNHLFISSVILFTFIFVGLSILVGSLLIDKHSLLSVVFFFGFEILLVGIAYDLTESILATLLSPEYPPKQCSLKNTPSVALLITVCDDVIPEVLDQLCNQTYSNYDIFVLDDSSQEEQREIVNQFGYLIIRRGTRRGFKAGNINNWLDKFGHNYKYFVVLDSDSVLPDEFIKNMVAYAEHPENEYIGLFQSKIRSWNTSSLFPRTLGSIIPLRQYILERVSNQNGMLLAYGLNYMCRTDCVLRVGGFHENVSAEDTTLSLLLSSIGYAVKFVDVRSYYSEPQNLFYYRRQISRWAAQTMELFHLPWGSAAFKLKVRICFGLYNYLRPFVYLILLLIAAWTVQAEGLSIYNLINSVVKYQLYYSSWFAILFTVTCIWILHISLHLILARKAGISLRNYLLYLLLVQSLMYYALLQVGTSIIQTALGIKVKFEATNSRISSRPTFKVIASCMWLPITYSGLVLLGVMFRNHYLLFSPSFLWLSIFFLAPLLLWVFHIDNVSLEEEANGL